MQGNKSISLYDRIETVMQSTGRPSPTWLRMGLYAISEVYGLGLRLRSAAYRNGMLKPLQLPCIVISIGNITLGGTGKTPLTIYMAEMLHRRGYRVAIVSRGYGGRAEKSGAIVSDGSRILVSAEVSGDEPYMMGQQLSGIPILVGANRYRSGKIAIKRFKPDIILLDDGFQHRRLARDLDLVLLDARRPWGNGYLFPRGGLRETPSALKRGHAIVLTRASQGLAEPEGILAPVLRSVPYFTSQHRLKLVRVISAVSDGATKSNKSVSGIDFMFLHGKRVLVFSGIARNLEFFKLVQEVGCQIVQTMKFRDHYQYNHSDMEHICKQALDQRAHYVLTTEKDFCRMSNLYQGRCDLIVVGADMVFHDGTFDEFIADRVAALTNDKQAKMRFHNGSG